MHLIDCRACLLDLLTILESSFESCLSTEADSPERRLADRWLWPSPESPLQHLLGKLTNCVGHLRLRETRCAEEMPCKSR